MASYRGHQTWAKILAVLAIFFLHACASQSYDATQNQQPLVSTWEAQQQRNSALSHWRARGKLRISDILQDKDQNVRLYWRQEVDDYHIQLSGPAGFGRIILKGGDSNISVKTSDGETTFTNVEHAFEYYRLPPLAVMHLRYWMLGLSSPLTSIENQQIEQGTLVSLEQDNWQVTFSDYQRVDDVLLPFEIHLENSLYSIDVNLYQWELEQPQTPEKPTDGKENSN